MFRINGYPFADREAACTCNTQKVEETCNAAVSRKAPYMVDKNGNNLFYVDSFGLRGQVPGECKYCYDTFIRGFKNSQTSNNQMSSEDY